MIPWVTIGEARAPDGGRLVLTRRDHEWVIRVDGNELMSSRAHGSEDALARLALEGRRGGSDAGPCPGRGAGLLGARVLVGGLGMGYTLRATLDLLGPGDQVVVAEVVPAVVAWNRGELGSVSGRPLDDPRVTVREEDVGAVLRTTTARWDAVLLDVDNGPTALTRPANQALYGETGLRQAKATLKPGGVLAVWSAAPDDKFARLLRKIGLDVRVEQIPARDAARGVKHTIFLGRTTALGVRPG